MITIHPTAGQDLAWVGRDLKRILGRMNGKEPDLVVSTTPTGLVLGSVSQFNAFVDDPDLRMRGRFDGREAFVIRPDPDLHLLWIIGNTELGAAHGAYSLLQDQGYRALLPGARWEVIPARDRLNVRVSHGRPDILSRSIWAGFGAFDKEMQADFLAWTRRNLLGASLTGAVGHSWESIIRTMPERFADNPDLYGMRADGTVNRQSLRHGTTAAVDLTVAFFERRLAGKNPPDILSLAPTDGDNYSHDPETSGKGEISESFYWYVNEVAKRMRDVAPDRLVGTTAYFLHATPPSFPLEPNVFVLAASAFGSGGLPLDEFFAVWGRKAPFLGLRDYVFSGYQFQGDHVDGAMSRFQLERISRWLREHPFVSYSGEGLHEWGLRGHDYYAIARMLWDTKVEPDGALEDFCRAGFGPAGDAMYRYYTSLRPRGSRSGVPAYRIGQALRHLDAAEAAAGDDAEIMARIDDVKTFLIHVILLDRALALGKADPERHALVARLLEWNYRTRRSYMLNYNCNRRLWMVNARMLDGYLNRHRSQFWGPDDEPPSTPEAQTAVIQRVFGAGWVVNGGYIQPAEPALPPPTSAEIRATYAELRDHFAIRIEPVEEVSFSEDWVPVDTGIAWEPRPEGAINFNHGVRFVLWLPVPGPKSFAVLPNARYPRAPETSLRRSLDVTRTAAAGGPQERMRLMQDGILKHPTVGFPSAGVWFLDIESKGRGAQIQGGDWRYAGFRVGDTRPVHQADVVGEGMVEMPLCFYVPKGTRTVQAVVRSPAVRRDATFGPWGAGDAAHAYDRDLLAIEVPDGQDGKVWNIRGSVLRHDFAFLNLPNIIFLNPGRIVLPAEIAHADGWAVTEPH